MISLSSLKIVFYILTMTAQKATLLGLLSHLHIVTFTFCDLHDEVVYFNLYRAISTNNEKIMKPVGITIRNL